MFKLLCLSLVLHAHSLQACLSLAIPWTVACQALLFMAFSRQEYRTGLPFPPPRDLPDAGIEPVSLVSPARAGGGFTTEPPGSLMDADPAEITHPKLSQSW